MDHLSVQNYPENARIPIRGAFFDLSKNEVFFPVNVDGYRDIYRVSNYGRVMSARDISGATHYGKMLKPKTSRRGYLIVGLSNNGKAEHKSVHQLVLRTFIGEPPTEYHQAAHNDGVRTNNNVLNLRWATPKENTNDKFLHGTILKGEDNGSARLTEAQVLYIHAAYQSGKNSTELAEELGTSDGHISGILSGRRWSHLGLRTETRNNHISEDQITEIFELRAQGLPQREIANIVGCSKSRVGDLLKNPEGKPHARHPVWINHSRSP